MKKDTGKTSESDEKPTTNTNETSPSSEPSTQGNQFKDFH